MTFSVWVCVAMSPPEQMGLYEVLCNDTIDQLPVLIAFVWGHQGSEVGSTGSRSRRAVDARPPARIQSALPGPRPGRWRVDRGCLRQEVSRRDERRFDGRDS